LSRPAARSATCDPIQCSSLPRRALSSTHGTRTVRCHPSAHGGLYPRRWRRHTAPPSPFRQLPQPAAVGMGSRGGVLMRDASCEGLSPRTLVRRPRICVTRSISLARPTTGSRRPSSACLVRSVPYSISVGILLPPAAQPPHRHVAGSSEGSGSAPRERLNPIRSTQAGDTAPSPSTKGACPPVGHGATAGDVYDALQGGGRARERERDAPEEPPPTPAPTVSADSPTMRITCDHAADVTCPSSALDASGGQRDSRHDTGYAVE
jgi:hypothetical protein